MKQANKVKMSENKQQGIFAHKATTGHLAVLCHVSASNF